MTRLMIGIQLVFLVLMVFTAGINGEHNPVDGCMQMMKFEEEFDSIIKLEGPERLNLFCANMTKFFTCINNVMKEKTGMSVKELANHWLIKETEHGKFLNVVVQMEEFVDEICTQGTQLHEEYMVDNKCFNSSTAQAMQVKNCKDQAVNAYEIFKELQAEKSEEKKPSVGHQTDECVITAYQLGCIGATLYEACGEQAFNRYKNVMKRIGFFRSGICSPDLMETLKTTFLESLNMTDSRKTLYRTILDLRRRRRQIGSE